MKILSGVLKILRWVSEKAIFLYFYPFFKQNMKRNISVTILSVPSMHHCHDLIIIFPRFIRIKLNRFTLLLGAYLVYIVLFTLL